ncbi:protein DMP2-like [Abrus precatorius]|uniref:Protein DMP2-like n=1 Tax=Abrus precatorius TaxID=3816 RepID=A0A8B8K6U7_ABRPR|nr:protein DMP2-like [Abrus precatorius]
MTGETFSAVRSLTIKLLPPITLFLFQLLIPVVTNNGHCTNLNKYLTAALLVICVFGCVFAFFTDSYISPDGERHYAVVTAKGLWPSPASESVDSSVYRLRFGDLIHASLGLMVFAVGLLGTNTVRCFFPGFDSDDKILLQVLPPVFGAIASVVLLVFPNYRHH